MNIMDDNNFSDLSNNLIQLYSLLYDLYDKIFQIGQKQLKFIDEKRDIKEILNLLLQKEKLVDKTNQINKDFSHLKDEWQRTTQNSQNDEKAEVQKAISKVSELLENILDQDKVIEQHLLKSGTKIKQNLVNIQKGKRVHKAYKKYSNKNKFTDKKL